MSETIDLTPSWKSVVYILFATLENGSAKGKMLAQEEIKHMADCLDKQNDFVGQLTVDNLAQIIRQVDGNNSLCADELAEKILEKIREKS